MESFDLTFSSLYPFWNIFRKGSNKSSFFFVREIYNAYYEKHYKQKGEIGMNEERIINIIREYWAEQFDYLNDVDNFEIGWDEDEYHATWAKRDAADEILRRLAKAGFDVSQRTGA